MDCPVCREAMISLELNDVEIDYCVGCGGIWLDAGELGMLLGDAQAARALLASFDEYKGHSEKKRPCPICGKKMFKVLAGEGPSDLLIDKCRKNDGLWFDRGELGDVLARALEKIANDPAPQLAVANKATAPMYIANPSKRKGQSSLTDLTSTHPPISKRIKILRDMSGASYEDYSKAFTRVIGKATVVPQSGLKAEEAVPLRQSDAASSKDASEAQTFRQTGDLMRKVNGFSFLSCTCGMKLKVPPNFKAPSVSCPRCNRTLNLRAEDPRYKRCQRELQGTGFHFHVYPVAAWDADMDAVLRSAPAMVVAIAQEEAGNGMVDLSLALCYLELAAPKFGLGNCWAGMLRRGLINWPDLREAVGIPKGYPHFYPMMLECPTYSYHRMPQRKPPKIKTRTTTAASRMTSACSSTI